MHQCIKVVLRDCVHLPMAKDRLRLRIILSYCFSSLLTFFSSSSLWGFFSLNSDNFRMFLLCHVSSLSCYSLNILFDCLVYLLSYYIAHLFLSCMCFSLPEIPWVCHHCHQRNTFMPLCSHFYSTTCRVLELWKEMESWFDLFSSPSRQEGSGEWTKEALRVKPLWQQMLTHTCWILGIASLVIPAVPLEQERCAINTLSWELKILCHQTVHR